MSSELGRDDSAPASPSPAVARPTSSGIHHGTSSAPNEHLQKAVDDVMYSDIGVTTLLNRLKQSIASARDFASFLKKRSSLEEEQAKGLKRLAQSQLDSVRRGEVRSGTYAQQFTDVLRVHERMADHGMQFALSLHQMHEDLDVLSGNMERGRKQWKHEGLDAENKASAAEAAMQKAKARYDSLADEYDRAKTGDTKSSRRIGLKGPKSAEQYESDLMRKVETADTDYKDKVRQAQTQREQLVREHRPKAVRELQALIKESDSALSLQLQKFATFNEKLLLGNGLAVSPLTDNNSSVSQRSLRELVMGIDNDSDFHNYIAGHQGKIPARPSEIRYEQHPTLAPKTQQPKSMPTTAPAAAAAPPMQAPLTLNTASSQPGSMTSRTPASAAPPSSFSVQPPSSAGYGSGPPQVPSFPTNQPPYQADPTPLRDTYNNTPPYPTHPSERSGTGFSQHQQTTGSIPAVAPTQISPPRDYNGSSFGGPVSAGGFNGPPSAGGFNGPPSAGGPTGPPTESKTPVFGVSLDELFARDQSAVPIIVFQCIQAVDIFGLETEGIYRHNGTASQVNRLRQAFDHLPASSPQLDFRNPSNFGHDVNAVASLLKSFFRDLPDPLFTKVGYGQFIEAAQVDDENQRRDAIHQGINDLPDPNYATLRALVLHLNRIMQNESRTRMTAENLAVCFAPTLMGTHSGVIADASYQHRVLATILINATAIFDDD
ncbi:putative Rho-GTPase-activating protein 7 [Fulvia fulva]|uniref:Rho-GTPase-activating protein 7 n=1 Tax=Passalora fulva TaxID=5499 RepID=A0A9Q8PME9_PASFU|nr:putative Rho-GTPase-activating protein 7 [Fulvia fulva]KAK4609344.1 putative Rho-GTPase-activating protein 7 [Fulvia fulva]UJO25304.1 putative Rho-GTPase-activating protein 7 [Fulvia fulva]WPV22631.1 putative Rho-GTPase-activating protein 7 [Fulvia fulva]WPV37416.1 putative Rho-GTPase-activating protein 7 [Fulvia fulva]